MATPPSAGHSWTCPACSRQVPARIDVCRCGRTRELVEAAPRDAGGARAALPPAVWLAGALVVVLALWVGYSARTMTRVQGDSTWPGAAQPAAPDERQPGASSDAASESARNPVEASVGAPATEPPAAAAVGAPGPPPASPTASFEDTATRAIRAVVRVEAGGNAGSGFFVAPDTILTNAHVVAGLSSVTVRRWDGSSLPAHVVASSAEVDVTILKLPSPDASQEVLRMGSVAGLRSGQEIIAVGSPLGVLQGSVTRGIVSALRSVGGVTLVQTDAAVNPGNSGGPLLTRDGDVIGIATMTAAGQQGLSFGVAIDHARALLAGRQPVPGGQGTPLLNLNTAISEGRESSADSPREEGTRAYEAAIEAMAKYASAFDDEWSRFRSACYSQVIAGSFDREWFALYEPRAMRSPMSSGCEDARAQLRIQADAFRSKMAELGEAARRAGVYPGVLRETRARHRLEYSDWSR